jgi:integrase
LKHRAFRPGTRRNHACQFNLYCNFCDFYNLQPINPTVDTVCTYIAFLATKLKPFKSVNNYIGAVRLLHKYLGEPAPALDAFDTQLTLRAVKLTSRHAPTQKLPISPHLLTEMCAICDTLDSPQGRAIKCALTLAYFSFLRQSNLAPPSPNEFDATRHMCRGDVIISQKGTMHILVKWAKNMQTMDKPLLLQIPTPHDPAVDPALAFKRMVADTPTRHPNHPLLQLPAPDGYRIITVRDLRLALSVLLTECDKDPRLFSLHSLRRGGATAAFQQGADPIDIQRHGGWRSSAFYEYVRPTSSTVTAALAAPLGAQGRPLTRRRAAVPPDCDDSD